MSRHAVTVRWDNPDQTLVFEKYSRNHVWELDGGQVVPASAAPEYLGDPSRADPEGAYVASLSSCHMLTFLAIAARRKLVVTAYTDEAEGFLDKNPAGKLAMTRVQLQPIVSFAPEVNISDAEFEKMHQQAHAGCFIANSVTTRVTVAAIVNRRV